MNKDLAIVSGAGGMGGVLYWLLVNFAGDHVFQAWPWYGQLLGLLILGAAAGSVGVYMLTASDPKQTKTIVFAMVCGLVWKPILDSAMQVVKNGTINKQTADITDKTRSLGKITSSTRPEVIRANVEAAKPALMDAVKLIPEAQNLDQRTNLIKTTTDAVTALQNASSKDPQSVSVIKEVATQAIQANESSVAVHAIQSLGSISSGAGSAESKREASASLREIEEVATKANRPTDAALAQKLLTVSK